MLSKTNKLLCLILSLIMILVMLPAVVMTASAEELVSADIYVSYQYDGYIIPKQLVTVSSNLSDMYGYTDSVEDGVSALDALIAVHRLFYELMDGEYNETDFTEWLSDAFEIDAIYGGISECFGDMGYNILFAVNGEMPFDTSVVYPASAYGPASYLGLSIPETELCSGDYVEFFSCLSDWWDDCYTWFEYNGEKADKLFVNPGETIELSLVGYPYMTYGAATDEAYRNGSWTVDYSYCEDLPIVLLTVDSDTGYVSDETITYADEDGNFEVKFNTAGNYILSALGDEDWWQYIFAPWLEITVDYWEGKGTESEPYLLSSQADLKKLGELVAANNNFSQNKFFKLTENITLDSTWEPIGTTTSNRAFRGTFDGNGKKITFAYGSKPLFGTVFTDAVIKNLDIYGEYIASFGLVDDFNAGSVPASAVVVIDNVTIKSGTTIKKSGFLGDPGASRNGYTTAIQVDIKNCTAESGVKIGWDDEKAAPYDNSEYVEATVSGAGSSGPGTGSFIDGLCGTIDNCKSSATVYGQNNVGGIAGYKAQTMRSCVITNCEFDGKIIAAGDFVGGIIGSGYNHSSSSNPPGVTIKKCTVTGNIAGNDYVGGIFGGEGGQMQAWNESEISGNNFAGTVTANANAEYVGGIIGYMHSLNKLNIIANNKYSEECGADKGIGGAKYIDTNYENPTEIDGVIYFNTDGITTAELAAIRTELGLPSGISTINRNRTDDPLGADADNLAGKTDSGTTPTDPINPPNPPSGDSMTVTISIGSWVSGAKYTFTSKSITVYDVFMKAVNDKGLTQTGAENGYVKSINGLAELDKGPNSGWIYTVNGTSPEMGLKDCVVKNGDVIVWSYTEDYTQTPNIPGVNPPSSGTDNQDNGSKEPGTNETGDGKEQNTDDTVKVPIEDWDNPFNDVKESDWFYEAVYYAQVNGLMIGIAENKFAPDSGMTRAMIVTILWRYEGSPETKGNNFTDVADGEWYSDAIAWASENGIVNGYGNGIFGVNDNITREQFAVILYRYAEYKEFDVSKTADLSGFSDADKISDWALIAVKWAVAEGLIKGRSATIIAPDGTANRAEAATLFMRYIEDFIK